MSEGKKGREKSKIPSYGKESEGVHVWNGKDSLIMEISVEETGERYLLSGSRQKKSHPV